MNRSMILALLLLLLPALALAADDHRDSESTPLPEISVSGQALSRADFGNDRGAVAVAGARTGFKWDFLSIEDSVDHYDWSDKDKLPLGKRSDDPWKNLHALNLGLEHFEMPVEDWGWFAMGGVGTAYEEEMDDSFSASATGGAIYALSPRTMLMIGVHTGISSIEASVFPALMLKYDGRDQQSGEGWFATLGVPQAELGYALDRSLSVALNFSEEGDTYRLADDSKVERKGFAAINAHRLGLHLDWDVTEHFNLSFGPSWHFGRSIQTYNDDGDRRNEYDLGDSVGLGLALGYRF